MNAQSSKLGPSPRSVAVIMATFNRAHLISEAIDSLLNQTRPPDEFIVVNDGSTDDTAKVVRRYGTKIKYVEKSNGGKSSALNLALPCVESAYTWIFDDDDVALPGALETHLKFLGEHREVDFSYSTNYVFSGPFSEDALPRGKLKAFPTVPDGEYLIWIMESPFLTSLQPGMLIPTRCYRAVGEFDEKLIRGQDRDMVLRIARHFRAGFIGQPTFAERMHSGERGSANERHAEIDRYQVWRQYKRQIFGKVRASLALAEYLPRSTVQSSESRDLSLVETRQALLQRAVIMATHGLFPETIEDVREYIGHLDSAGRAVTGKESRKLSMLAWVRGPEALPAVAYCRQLGVLVRGRPLLFRAVMRGLYWSITREVRRRHPLFAARLAGLALTLWCAYFRLPAISGRAARGFQ